MYRRSIATILSCFLSLSIIITLCPADKIPKFYIYDWPAKFSDVYPPKDAVLHKETTYDHAFNNNNGAGRIINKQYGLFQTWQFSLYRNIITRMFISEHRTKNPAEATAFIVPYDAGVHTYIDHNNGYPRLGSPYAWSVINYLKEAQQDPVLWKNNGHDHFVFFGLTEFVMTGIGNKEFWMGMCQNCTALAVETSPTQSSTPYHRSRKYWYSVPYPSSFHWYDGIETLPWSVQADVSQRSGILALFIGSTKTQNSKSNMLRRVLYEHCSGDTACQWHHTKHSCNGVINATDTMMLLLKSKFCIVPPGDTVTRKSAFDSLLAGCVPVIFAQATLSQYRWFISDEELEEAAVYIPATDVTENGVKFLDVLKAITPEELLKKQRVIERIAPRLQYSVIPEWAYTYTREGTVGSNFSYVKIPRPPVEDAADIIIRHVLDRRTVEPINGFSDEELGNLNCLQDYLMKSHKDYAGMFHGSQHLNRGKKDKGVWDRNNCHEMNYAEQDIRIFPK